MIIKTRSLTESLEKKYGLDEAYEYETADELDYIMDDDSLSDEEKEKSIDDVLTKYDEENNTLEEGAPKEDEIPFKEIDFSDSEDAKNLNESFVEEWWGQTDEDPFDFAYEYGLGCAKIGQKDDMILYRFSGDKEDIKNAIRDGYFYSVEYGEDEGHSEDLDESLNEARNPENDEVNDAIRRYFDSEKAYVPKKDRDLFDKYGITPDRLQRRRGRGKEKIMKGSNGDVMGAEIPDMVHPDYDLAGSLTKERPMSGSDKEIPTQDYMFTRNIFGNKPEYTKKDDSRISHNQFQSLQPYATEKDLIWDAANERKRIKSDEERRIQDIKDNTERSMQRLADQKKRAIDMANVKRHKEESLNESQLNEYIDDEEFQWFVGDNQSGYMYPNEQFAISAVNEYIAHAKDTEGCEIISIVVVPQDGAGNDLL